jgi:hypothetical protein
VKESALQQARSEAEEQAAKALAEEVARVRPRPTRAWPQSSPASARKPTRRSRPRWSA